MNYLINLSEASIFIPGIRLTDQAACGKDSGDDR
jgi:hypothetical protein